MNNEARIETSTLCNYKCTFCPHKDLNRKKEIMGFDLFIKIIEKLPKNINTITLSGLGEMFLDPTIFKKIQFLKDLGYIVNALTNGSLMTEEMVKELNESGIDSIRISIHDIDYLGYNKITGASLREYENVHYLLDNISKDIYSIITVDMIEEDEIKVEMFKQIYEKKVDLLEIWKVHNWINWGEYREGKRSKLTCGRPKNGPLQIQVDGTVNMCCFDYDGELELGDLKTQSIEEIFNSDMYNDIKKYHSGEDIKRKIKCKFCDQLYEKDESVLIYNSKYGNERIGTLSTTYKEL